MWKPKSLLTALLPMYIINLMLGCNFIRFPIDKIKFKLSICYSIIYLTSYCICGFYTLKYSFSSVWFRPTEQLIFYVLYAHFFMMVLNMVLIYPYSNVSIYLNYYYLKYLV